MRLVQIQIFLKHTYKATIFGVAIKLKQCKLL